MTGLSIKNRTFFQLISILFVVLLVSCARTATCESDTVVASVKIPFGWSDDAYGPGSAAGCTRLYAKPRFSYKTFPLVLITVLPKSDSQPTEIPGRWEAAVTGQVARFADTGLSETASEIVEGPEHDFIDGNAAIRGTVAHRYEVYDRSMSWPALVAEEIWLVDTGGEDVLIIGSMVFFYAEDYESKEGKEVMRLISEAIRKIKIVSKE